MVFTNLLNTISTKNYDCSGELNLGSQFFFRNNIQNMNHEHIQRRVFKLFGYGEGYPWGILTQDENSDTRENILRKLIPGKCQKYHSHLLIFLVFISSDHKRVEWEHFTFMIIVHVYCTKILMKFINAICIWRKVFI